MRSGGGLAHHGPPAPGWHHRERRRPLPPDIPPRGAADDVCGPPPQPSLPLRRLRRGPAAPTGVAFPGAGGDVLHQARRPWAAAWGVARHESAVSARTPALWVAPALWALAPVFYLLRSGSLPAALGITTTQSYFAGLLTAAVAVSLPGRTRAARATDLLAGLPGADLVAAGRVLAALWAATALAAMAPVVGLVVAALRGLPLAGSVGPLGTYLAILPTVWVEAMLGQLAGTVIRDMRLAALVVFLGGVAARAVQSDPLALTPWGAWHLSDSGAGGPDALPWPWHLLLPWHVLAMVATAALGVAAGLWRRRTLETALLPLGGAAGVVVGVPVGALLAPGAAPRFLGGGLQRYGDKAQIWLDGPSQVQRGALLGSLANLLWGPGATPFSRADPLLRFYLQQWYPRRPPCGRVCPRRSGEAWARVRGDRQRSSRCVPPSAVCSRRPAARCWPASTTWTRKGNSPTPRSWPPWRGPKGGRRERVARVTWRGGRVLGRGGGAAGAGEAGHPPRIWRVVRRGRPAEAWTGPKRREGRPWRGDRSRGTRSPCPGRWARRGWSPSRRSARPPGNRRPRPSPRPCGQATRRRWPGPSASTSPAWPGT